MHYTSPGRIGKSIPRIPPNSRRPRSWVPVTLLALLIFAGCSGTSEPDGPVYSDDPGILYTWGGTGQAGYDGDGHTPLNSWFYQPIDVLVTSGGDVYVVDYNNHAVRRLQVDGTLHTVIGDGYVGDGPPDQDDFDEPGVPGRTVSLNHPTDLVELQDGRILLSAWHNHKLRRYDPATGLVRVVCGAGAGFEGDGGEASDALLNQPTATVVTDTGELYILDQRNERVRRIDADGVITSVVGTGDRGFGGDNGPPSDAMISLPAGGNPPTAGGLAIDAAGRIFISDSENQRIRMVDFGADIITTIAGTGEAGFSGDGGPATQAMLNNPLDLEIGPDGRLYVADELNHRIRAIDLDTGVITTVAGKGTQGFSGDRGSALEAELNRPQGIGFDGEGRIYIADTYNHRIRRMRLPEDAS